MAKKRRKPRRPRKPARDQVPRYDYHHILFQGRHWKQGYAKILRNHPYCGAYIPQQTLHREIHSKVHDVPTPNGKDCKEALITINGWLESGVISIDDPLDVKIEMITRCFRDKCPATVAILDWQHEIVTKFYERGE